MHTFSMTNTENEIFETLHCMKQNQNRSVQNDSNEAVGNDALVCRCYRYASGLGGATVFITFPAQLIGVHTK